MFKILKIKIESLAIFKLNLSCGSLIRLNKNDVYKNEIATDRLFLTLR